MSYCQHCGNPLREGSKFCRECGAPVAASVQMPPLPQPSAPPVQPVKERGRCISPDPRSTAAATEKKRGGCLSALLIFNLIVSPLSGLVLILGSSTMRDVLGIPYKVIMLTGILAIVSFVCVIGVWKWKRWGVYGWIGLALLTFLVNTIAGAPANGLAGLVGIGLLLLLIRPVWHQME
jgi:hypothetical protein